MRKSRFTEAQIIGIIKEQEAGWRRDECLNEEIFDSLGPVRYFVREAGYRHQMTNRSPKITANWVFASAHSRGGRFHSSAALSSTRYSSFIAAS